MKQCLLDANVVVRFLLQDHPRMSAGASELFEDCAGGKVHLHLQSAILAEIVFVLNGFYRIARADLRDAMLDLFAIPNLTMEDPAVARDALDRFCRWKVDFPDALLAAAAVSSGCSVATYDRDFERFPDVRRHPMP